MTVTRSILAVIPARGGSKGVPRKNIRDFAGRPLIAHTIVAARAMKCAARVVVSTDDAEIADVARAHGAEVPFLRPAELAADETPTLPVLRDLLMRLAGEPYAPHLVVLLQPTSPLRTARHIDDALDQYDASGADSLISVCPVSQHPALMKTIDAAGRVAPFLPGSPRAARRQDLPAVYRPNGAIYITRPDLILDENRLLGDDTLAFMMTEAESVDLDSELDFVIAELILRERCRKP